MPHDRATLLNPSPDTNDSADYAAWDDDAAWSLYQTPEAPQTSSARSESSLDAWTNPATREAWECTGECSQHQSTQTFAALPLFVEPGQCPGDLMAGHTGSMPSSNARRSPEVGQRQDRVYPSGSSSLFTTPSESVTGLFPSSSRPASGSSGVNVGEASGGDYFAYMASTPREMPAQPQASFQERNAQQPSKSQDPLRAPRNKRKAHNTVEKRYRMNLNAKIAELGDCIPSLRTATSTSTSVSDEDDALGREGLPSSCSQNFKKGEVLAKATEYILELKREIDALRTENADMRRRMALLRNLTSPGSTGP